MCDALMQHELACRDEEARDNVAKRLANQPHSGYTQFELKVDDKVSHKGKAYTLKEKTGYGSKTVTATLEDGWQAEASAVRRAEASSDAKANEVHQ